MFEFTIHINSESDEDFTDDFLYAAPVPVTQTGQALYTPTEWVKQWTVAVLEKNRLRGARVKKAATEQTDPAIVTFT